jgi:nicotinamidase-related amidase
MRYEVKENVEIPAKESALIVVDMQNDFAHERGSLFVPESRRTIEPIRLLIEKFRGKNSTVIYTQDWHSEDDPEFKIWGRHAVDHILRIKGIKNLVIVGTVANICVLHTAGSAALRWYNVIIPMDGISALSEEDYHFTLHQVDFLYKGVIVKNHEGIILI